MTKRILFAILYVTYMFWAAGPTEASPTYATHTSANGRTFQFGYDAARFAGAITSLREVKTTYDKVKRRNVTTYTEWLNSADAGRNLQTALHTNERGECYNPTQGGNWTEYSTTLTSKLVEAWVSGVQLHTKTQMAFWLRPGDTRTPQPGYCPLGRAENTTKTSDYYVTHDVMAIDLNGTPVLVFTIAVDTPEANNSVVFETLTGYMTGAFSNFRLFDPVTRQLVPGQTQPGEQPKPSVMYADTARAVGIYCDAGANYSQYNFVKLAGIYTMKWNAVHRTAYSPPGRYQATCYMPIGSVSEVTARLQSIVP